MNLHFPRFTRSLLLSGLVLLLTTSTVVAQEKLTVEETILTPELAGTNIKKSAVVIDPSQVVLAQPGEEIDVGSLQTNETDPFQAPAGKTNAVWGTQVNISTLSGDQTAPNMVTDASDNVYVARRAGNNR